jgi:CubicO group peptidase (beta-lactamase class C family)
MNLTSGRHRGVAVESFVAYHGVDAAGHQQRFDDLSGQGFRMSWINVSGEPGDATYAAVWVGNDGRGWAGLHNLDADGYQARFDELTSQGLVPSVISVAGTSGAVFAAVFEQRDVGNWSARHGLIWGAEDQPDTLVSVMVGLANSGHLPRCLAVYGPADDRRYAGVWWQNPDAAHWSWWFGTADFHQLVFDALSAGGLRPASLAVGPDGTVLSVFRDDQVGPVVARHRIDANEYQAEFDRQQQLGRRPIVVAAGGDGAGKQYAAVFAEQELPLPRQWSVTVGAAGPAPDAAAQIESAIADVMRRFGVRSASFALAKAGTLHLSHGYTWAEPGYPVTQPDSLFRQASVSKIFASAAARALHDDGVFGLDSSILDSLGVTTTLPAGGTIDARLRQVTPRFVATRRSGLKRDPWGTRTDGSTGDTNFRDIGLAAGRTGPPTLDDIVQYIAGMPMDGDPGGAIPAGAGGYSNVAFFLLTRLLQQQVPNSDVAGYLNARLLAPLGITPDLAVGNTAAGARLPGEVAGYDSAGAGPSMLNLTGPWAAAAYGGTLLTEVAPGAGGFITSSVTVARFIGSHSVWDLGDDDAGTRNIATRYGDFEGTATIAQSRSSGVDLAIAFSYWVPDDAKDALLGVLGPIVDGLAPSL